MGVCTWERPFCLAPKAAMGIPLTLRLKDRSLIKMGAFEAGAKGDCPTDLMEQGLLDACRQHIAVIGPQVAANGKIIKLDFLGWQSSIGNPAELWRVTYEHGTQIWSIDVWLDGKIHYMFSRDD